MNNEDQTIPPLIAQLLTQPDVFEVTETNIDEHLAERGFLLLFFTADPHRFRETLDVAVVAPELIKAFATIAPIRLGVLLPESARACQARYGFKRWPSFVLLKDGLYLGAMEGMKSWEEFGSELMQLLNAEPSKPPTIGIPIQAVDASKKYH